MSLPTDDKSRKLLPIFTFLTEYFPDAILEMVRVSVAGNIQHNPELDPADIHWARGKSMKQMDTAFRHMWDHKRGVSKDVDGQYHLAKAMWRIGAELQLQIEKDRAPPAEAGAQVRSCPQCGANSPGPGIVHICPAGDTPFSRALRHLNDQTDKLI